MTSTNLALVNSIITQWKQSFPSSENLTPAINALLKLHNLTEQDLQNEFLPFGLNEIFVEGVRVMHEKEDEENNDTEFKTFIKTLKDKGYFNGEDGNVLPSDSKVYRERFYKAKLRFKMKAQDSKLTAEKFKNEGNELMKAKKFEEAVEAYKNAIQNDATNAIYFANLAAAYSSLQKFQEAIEAGKKALELDPSYSKASFRVATAYEKLGKKSDALKYFQISLDIEPSNSVYEDNVRRLSRQSAPAPRGGMPFPGGMPDMSSMFPGGMPDMSSMFPNGMPDMSSMFGNGMPDMSSMLSNPQFMEMANNLMQNDDFKRAAENMMSTMGFDKNKMTEQFVSAIEDDEGASNPRVQEMVEDIKANGMDVIQNYAEDPTVREVVERVRSKLMSGFGM